MTRIPIYSRRNRPPAKNAASAEAARISGSTPHQRPAGTGDGDAAHEQSSKPTRTPADLPDPTVVREDDRLDEGPVGTSPTADPTVPAVIPVDTKSRHLNILGSVADEVDGPGGADVTGGDITAPKDADAAVEENIRERTGEVDMWERQAKGEVDTQTEHLKPAATHPDEGMPSSATGQESSSGGSDETATESASASSGHASAGGNGAQSEGTQEGHAGDSTRIFCVWPPTLRTSSVRQRAARARHESAPSGPCWRICCRCSTTSSAHCRLPGVRVMWNRCAWALNSSRSSCGTR